MFTVSKKDQSGASALILTMFFIMIITLIVISFTTIVRREQSATLENNLAKQAQLAAESGINSVKTYIDKIKATGAQPQSNTACDPSGIPQFNAQAKAEFDGTGINLTCLTWDMTPTEYDFTLDPYSSNSFTLENSPGNPNNTGWGHTFQLTWKSNQNATSVYSSLPTPTTLPDIASSNASIIKLVTVSMSEVTNFQATQVVYLVPYNGGSIVPACTTVGCSTNTYVDLNNAGIGTASAELARGTVYYVPCSGGTCSVSIQGMRWPDYPSNTRGPQGFYFENIGATTSSVAFTPSAQYAGQNPLKGVVAKVDSNAMVQDISKRVIAYIPLQPRIWQPNFSAYSETLCKNYKVDGSTNGVAPTGSTTPACP